MAEREKSSVAVEFTRGLGELFFKNKFSLIASTYQAQRILLISGDDKGKISVLNRALPRPMGISLSSGELAVGCKNAIWFFSLSPEVSDPQGKRLPYDLVFLPRRAHVTGDVLIHQISHVKNQMVFANTRFSCLSELHPDHSFTTFWKPPFISKISGDDRCHLNGMAIRDGRVRYVSILAESDSPAGWRSKGTGAGMMYDTSLNKPVASGLSMPHSPIWHEGRLWCIESALAQLVAIDVASGKKDVVTKVAGYARGLEIYKNYAFIGISKFRDKSLAVDLLVSAPKNEPICAIQVFELSSKRLIGAIEFKGSIDELFDIKVIPGVRRPFMVGFEGEMIDQVFSIAPPRS